MLVSIRLLRHPKSENVVTPEVDSCEDWAEVDLARGVVAVCDGVGTSSFAALWARLLAQYAVATPLHSTDPFELERWLRQAQPLYWEQTPNPVTLPYFAQKKARTGAYTTLLQLTVTEVVSAPAIGQSLPPASARLRLVAMGDSCAMLARADGTFAGFPCAQPACFTSTPFSLPANAREFDRDFHVAQESYFDVFPGDLVVCLTDALGLWVVNAAQRGQTPAEALRELAAQNPASWGGWVETLRRGGAIMDDDSTAVIMRFAAAAPGAGSPAHELARGAEPGATDNESWQPLVAAMAPTAELAAVRAEELRRALADRDLPAAALAWGDGVLLRQHAPEGLPANEVIEHARTVSAAINRVWWALKQALAWNDAVRGAALLEETWRPYADLLRDEPCAAQLRQSLLEKGVSVEAPRLVTVEESAAAPPPLIQIEHNRETPEQQTNARAQGIIEAEGRIAPAELLEQCDQLQQEALCRLLPTALINKLVLLRKQRDYAQQVRNASSQGASAFEFELCRRDETLLADNPFLSSSERHAYDKACHERARVEEFRRAVHDGDITRASEIYDTALYSSKLIGLSEIEDLKRSRIRHKVQIDLEEAVRARDAAATAAAYGRLLAAQASVPPGLVAQVQALRLLDARARKDDWAAITIALSDLSLSPLEDVPAAQVAAWRAARDLCTLLLVRSAGSRASAKELGDARDAYAALKRNAPQLLEGIAPPGAEIPAARRGHNSFWRK